MSSNCRRCSGLARCATAWAMSSSSGRRTSMTFRSSSSRHAETMQPRPSRRRSRPLLARRIRYCRFDCPRSRNKSVRCFCFTARTEPVPDGGERDRCGWLAIRPPDPGRERLRSLYKPDVAQAVTLPSCGLYLAKHRRRVGAVSFEPRLIGDDDLARIRRRHCRQYRHARTADAEWTARPDLDRQDLDRKSPDAARYA